jgi:hypothetical protein
MIMALQGRNHFGISKHKSDSEKITSVPYHTFRIVLGCWRVFLVDFGHHFLPSSLAHTGPMSPDWTIFAGEACMTQSCTPSVTSCRPLPLSSTYLERHSWCGPWYLPWQGLKSKPSDTKKLVPGNDVLLSKWRHRFGYSNHLIVFASGLFPYPSIHYPTFRNDLRAGRPGKFRWFEAVVELWKHRSISQSIRLHHVRIPESRLGAS